MAFDAMFLKAMTEEIKEGAESGRIMKIHQPFPHELLLYIRKNRENRRLLISAHPSYARVQWTNDVPENPPNPPMFCMLLRKHLEGAIIEEIRQEPNERILVLFFRGKDDIGENRFLDLYIEIMGRHSNLTLVDRQKGTIIDCIKHISPAQNSYRTLLPGAKYILPPKANKIDPFTVSTADFESFILPEENPVKSLVKHFAGFSPLLAWEIVHRAKDTSSKMLQSAFSSVLEEIPTFLGKKAVPHTFVHNEKEDYYFMPLALEASSKRYDSLSELLDAFYSGKARRDRVHQMGHDLERLLANERTRNVLKIEKLENTLLETEKADEFRIKGELLTANLYQMEKGAEQITVQNFYDDALQDVTIALDTRLTPSQNAQRYFTRYQKLRNAVAYVREQIALTQEEVAYLDGVLAQLETAGPSDVEEIRQELAEQGYIRYKKPKNSRQKNALPKLEKYTATSGLPILVGKNNKQNEYLTNKLAKNNELWFHVKDLPGSHVVIQDSNPDETAIEEAAMIAAYFSKARLSSTVPVDATLIKHVKKPNGAKPGYVIYDNQTTYFVTPDVEKVQALKDK